MSLGNASTTISYPSRTATEAKMRLLEYSTVFGLCKDKPIRVYSSLKEMIDEEKK